MKIILSLVVIFLIQNFELINNESNHENPIIGRWTNCATKSGEYTIMANVCRTFVFKSDNKGFVVRPKGDSLNFNWNVINDTLTLSNLTGYDYFKNNTIFKLKYSENNSELALNSCIFSDSYILLSKTK